MTSFISIQDLLEVIDFTQEIENLTEELTSSGVEVECISCEISSFYLKIDCDSPSDLSASIGALCQYLIEVEVTEFNLCLT